MSGGITQLVATGVQDMYLSGTPEISFFRSSYKRYTHFAANVERQLIQGTPGPSGVSTIRFEKKGDLLSHVYLTALDANIASNVNVNWSTIISKMELMIGGQIIDTQDFTWTSNIEPVYGAQTFSNKTFKKDQASSVFFPLKFFFCKDWQNALPLVALQYHDVEIRITWANPNPGDQYAVWTRFIYLDKDEREWFAKQKHDMLIQQVTRVPMSDKNSYEFALSQPIKYIAFESNSYSAVYNTSLPLVNTSTTLQVLVNTGTQPTYLNLQALTSVFQGPTYISAVSGNDVTFSYQSQAAVPVPQGQMIDLGPLTLTATSNITNVNTSGITGGTGSFTGASTVTSQVVTSTANPPLGSIVTIASGYTGFGQVTATSGSSFTVAITSQTTTTVTSVALTIYTTALTIVSSGASTTNSSVTCTVPYTANTLLVGTVVTVAGIIGPAVVSTVSAGTSFTLTYGTQPASITAIPSGATFTLFPLTAPSTFTLTFAGNLTALYGSFAFANNNNAYINNLPYVLQASAPTYNSTSNLSSITFTSQGPILTNITTPTVTFNPFASTAATISPASGITNTTISSTFTISTISAALAAALIGTVMTSATPVVTGPIIVTAATTTTLTLSFPPQTSPSITTSTVFSYYLGSAAVATPVTTTQATILYTGTTLTVGQQVALPQIVGQATVTAASAGSFTLTYVSQTAPVIPNGQQFFSFAPNIFTDTAYTPVSLNQGSLAASYMQFKMQINGNDIGESRHLPHWQDINQYYLSPFGYDSTTPNNVVIVPFCLDTSKLQPTGTLNFSRIDTFRLVAPVQTNFQQLSRFGTGSYFYAVNYNILRIQNGMAGILYSS